MEGIICIYFLHKIFTSQIKSIIYFSCEKIIILLIPIEKELRKYFDFDYAERNCCDNYIKYKLRNCLSVDF